MYRTYLRVLSSLYFLAASLRALDILDWRLLFSRMGTLGQAWTIYLFLSDLLAAVALLLPSQVGELVFALVIGTQLAVFVAWAPYLGDQNFTLVFHLITLSLFLGLVTYRARTMEAEK